MASTNQKISSILRRSLRAASSDGKGKDQEVSVSPVEVAAPNLCLSLFRRPKSQRAHETD